MPIPSNPPYLLDVIGSQADVFSIPETTPEGSGALSYTSGWPQIVATALSAGGLPPQREYFNAVNKLLSQHVFFLQSGGVYPWSSALDYSPGARVMGSNGIVYVAVAASGPDVSEVGARNPTTDSANTYWQTLAASLMNSSGGLVVDPETGQASVDFSQMPTDKFEELLQSIRVPIWLTKTTNVYVATNGVDSAESGRGFSPSMPWATLQYALEYMAENYNISDNVLYINIAAGEYGETNSASVQGIDLPNFTNIGGSVVIKGAGMGETVIHGYIQNRVASTNIYHVRDLTLIQDTTSDSPYLYNVTLEYQAVVQFQRVHFIFTPTQGKEGHEIIRAVSGRLVFGYYNSASNLDNACQMTVGPSGCISLISGVGAGASVNIQTEVTINGTVNVTSGAIRASQLSTVNMRGIHGADTQGKLIQGTGSITGYRGSAILNSILRLPQGQSAEDCLVGTIDPQTATGGQVA